MIEWREDGALLSVRPHGETAAIIEVFTAGHGRHAGVVHGGTARRMMPVLQPGAQLALTWRARLDDHIGTFTVEPLAARAAALLADRAALAGLSAVCALLSFALPERAPHPDLYAASLALLDRLGHGPGWEADYLRWEMLLLEDMGFGLDLTACAVTGAAEDLAFVSPRSGRAVSRSGAGAWADRLLPLPALLRPEGPAAPAPRPEELRDGLRLTGHFLTTWLAPALGDRSLPAARQRLTDLIGRG